MRKLVLLTATVLLGLAVFTPLPSHGCIAIPIRPDNSQQEMNLALQRAFIYRQGPMEHLILSVQFDGATDEFAWVIPTETAAKVKAQEGAPFHELVKLTRLVQALRAPQVGKAGTKEAAPNRQSVQVIERKKTGPYDIAILKASDSGGLYKWLRDNGFGVNQNTRAALDGYVQKKWYFVAARIRPSKKKQASAALRSGTIAPLHITYRASELSYPMRVTSGNPGPSKIELFVLGDHPTRHAGLTATTFRLTPKGQGFKVDGPANRAVKRGDFPTLRKLIPRGGTLTKYSGRLVTAQRQRDLIFDRMAATKVKVPTQEGWEVPSDM